MISYEHGRWGVLFAFQLRGAVFPKAFAWSIPCAIAAIGLHHAKVHSDISSTTSTGTVSMTFGAFLTILGFMIVFRSSQAYSRYWEGATIIQKVRGEWFNTISSLMAFCSKKPSDGDRVLEFQHQMIRLMSLLFGTAISTITEETTYYEVMNQRGLDQRSIDFMLNEVPDFREGRCEVILYWIQRIIVEGHSSGILTIPPPILSRVFQELSRGVVSINSARKINELPFPFHYAQMLAVMLMLFTGGVPFVCAYMMESWYGAACAAFLNVTVLWSVNYLAVEIERPFGHDANDLPLHSEVERMNSMLLILCKPGVNISPSYDEPIDINLQPETLQQVMSHSSTVCYEEHMEKYSLNHETSIDSSTPIQVVVAQPAKSSPVLPFSPVPVQPMKPGCTAGLRSAGAPAIQLPEEVVTKHGIGSQSSQQNSADAAGGTPTAWQASGALPSTTQGNIMPKRLEPDFRQRPLASLAMDMQIQSLDGSSASMVSANAKSDYREASALVVASAPGTDMGADTLISVPRAVLASQAASSRSQSSSSSEHV